MITTKQIKEAAAKSSGLQICQIRCSCYEYCEVSKENKIVCAKKYMQGFEAGINWYKKQLNKQSKINNNG